MALHLDSTAASWVLRVPTDGRRVDDVAALVRRADQRSLQGGQELRAERLDRGVAPHGLPHGPAVAGRHDG